MPSFDHEALLELFRRRPTLASELLRDELHVWLPVDEHVYVADSSLTEVVPTERKADLVLLSSPAPGSPAKRALIVEVQLSVDPEKRRSWWWYLASVHARYRCDAVLLVVTPSAQVAAWAGRPIALGHPGVSLQPLVVGPGTVPVVRDEESATRAPELAVLSAMIYGQTEVATEVGKAALAAVRRLDEERAALYTDCIFGSMHAAARGILEALMANGNYEYKSEFALRYVRKGEAHGRASAILSVLTARGVEIPPDVRERVLACTDVALLDAWIARAANAKEVGEVVGE